MTQWISSVVGRTAASGGLCTLAVLAGISGYHVPAAALLVIALLISILSVWDTVRAAEGLRDVCVSARSGDLSRRARAAGPRELSAVAKDLNLAFAAISERLDAFALEKSHLEALVLGMPDALLATDARGRIVLANPAAERVTGTSYRVMSGKHILEILREHQLADLVDRALAGGDVGEAEIPVLREQQLVLRATAAPVRRGEGPTAGTIIILRDVTEVKHLEQVRADFVANVSHELRTPLTSIRGFVETLLDGAMNDPDTCRRFLTILDRDTERLARLINDLMDLSKLEASGSLPPFERVDLFEVAAETVALLGVRAAEKSIRVENAIEPDLPAVWGNPDMLQQVLYNLIENGIKYTPEGGEIKLTAIAKDGFVTVSCSDTGIGIPAHALPRIFERFYRVDRTRSRDLGGTGLGLALVKHAVERQGGTVTVESTVGQGSVFRFTVPLARSEG
ncbi:MAG: ATP-binding protein [Firmicutes bacterium]|jgi:two-component system phosphate regulon sensor histidine kinase PhoR|nr:ATP-binding protein [Bacillota bacterium]